MSTQAEPVLGDVEIAEIGMLLADRTRCRVLMALNDGRALAASVLADEAGVARSTASSHLAKLTEAGFLRVETHGRHRYYRLAGPHVGELLEKLTQIAPTRPVRSLREGNRGAQLRAARTCYDHLAGRLGVGVMAHLLATDYLVGGDGEFRPEQADADTVIGYGRDTEYTLTDAGWAFLGEQGIEIPTNSGRRLVRYCVDWSEQRHHVAGLLGRAILDHFLAREWIRRRTVGRSVALTPAGRDAVADIFHIDWA